MDSALFATAAVMGLAGSPHCSAMCGAAQCTLVRTMPGEHPPWQATLALHLGRLLSYSLAGALIGLSVSTLFAWREAMPFLRPFWVIAQVAMLALGGWLLWSGSPPRLASLYRGHRSVPVTFRPNRWTRRVGGRSRAALIGAGWAALPCGLLQSALLVAALASGPLAGAGVMAAFASSSAIGLLVVPPAWAALTGPRERATTRHLTRLAGLLLLLASGYALWGGIGARSWADLCTVPT